jgi:ComF family protein
VDGERICPHCEGLRPVYRRAKTVTLFKGPARELILTLKYRRGLYALEDIRALVQSNAEVMAHVRDAVLVPVPLHRRKLRERGYNQSLMLAELFSELTGGASPVAEVLERVQDGESQTAYDRRSRQRRMKNAFAARNGAAITPDQRYVLVDDVFTTGSTLNACAVALRRAGALTLDVVTFAHG